jgi:hypothetical protein
MKNSNKVYNNIVNKVMDCLNNGNYESLDNGYMENYLIINEKGEFHTTCRNEYGSNYGTIKQGKINLTRAQTKLIKDFSIIEMYID